MVFGAARSRFVSHISTLVFRVTISEGNNARGVSLLNALAQKVRGTSVEADGKHEGTKT